MRARASACGVCPFRSSWSPRKYVYVVPGASAMPGGLFGLGLKRVEGFSSLIMGTIPLRIVKTSHAAAAAARLAQGRGVTDCMP